MTRDDDTRPGGPRARRISSVTTLRPILVEERVSQALAIAGVDRDATAIVDAIRRAVTEWSIHDYDTGVAASLHEARRNQARAARAREAAQHMRERALRCTCGAMWTPLDGDGI